MDWGCQCEASPLRVRRLALSHSVAGVAQVPQFPPPAAPRPGAAVGRQGVRDYEPAHLVLGEVFLCGSWTAQGPIGCRPGRYRASVGYHSEPGVLRYYGGSGCLCPCGSGPYQCGVASAQCGGIGSPGAVVPQYQVTV